MGCKDMEELSPTARDHALVPCHFRELKEFHGHARITGPCGDMMEFWLKVRDGTVEDIAFITDGCNSSVACGSMAASLAEDKPKADAAAIRQWDILAAIGGFPEGSNFAGSSASRSSAWWRT
jgi:nitrogen fixation NifU-like protein